MGALGIDTMFCERSVSSAWGEPFNAFSSFAFLISAWWSWRGIERSPVQDGVRKAALVLIFLIAAIGVAGILFHGTGYLVFGHLSVAAIAAFSIVHTYAANRFYLELDPAPAALGVVALVPLSIILLYGALSVPVFAVVAPYWPVFIFILIYAVGVFRAGRKELGLGLLWVALILLVALIFNSIDTDVCSSWSFGTHFIWHVLTAIQLGLMIRLLLRHGHCTQTD